jgi:tetratricopeptide (TPR) repeat protein
MERLRARQNRSLYYLALLWTLLLLAARAEGSVRLPPVEEAPNLAWTRQPLFTFLSRWNLDPVVFDPLLSRDRNAPPEETGGPPPATLFRRASRLADEAGKKGNDRRLHEAAARTAMQAYAGSRGGDAGLKSLALAARSYFLAEMYTEAEGVATRLIERSGHGAAALPCYLLKGEILFRRKNFLTSRECFRRASAGRWDGATARRIALRIADISFLMGNPAYAEHAYRKVFREGNAVLRAHPLEGLRFGEALLAASMLEEAASVFRGVRDVSMPGFARAASYIGEGDALLLAKRYPQAENSYRYAEPWGKSPEIEGWIRCRIADLEFMKGKRKEAMARYRLLKETAAREPARESWFKWILCLHLVQEHEDVIREADAYLAADPEVPGAAAVREMAAKAGTELVRAAGKKDPARMWTVFTSYLFSFAKTDEGRNLVKTLGAVWERERLWGGASSLYATAGDAERGLEMTRVAAAEAAYFRGEFDNVLALLAAGDARRTPSAAALWLTAKTLFRQGRFEKAADALAGLEKLPQDAGAAAQDGGRELALYAAALKGKKDETRETLEKLDPKVAAPGLPYLRDWSGDNTSRRDKETVGGKTPAGGAGDLWTGIAAVQRRYRRIAADEGE